LNCRGKPELRVRLAAEFALGTLRGRARERLRRWLRDDPDLVREVQAWEARLAPMAAGLQPLTPPPRLWSKIEQRLTFKRPYSFWKTLGLVASGAVTALLVVAVLLPPQGAGVPASYVAVLTDPKTSHPVLVATAERAERVLRVSTLDPAIHVAGRSLELWALPRGAGRRSRSASCRPSAGRSSWRRRQTSRSGTCRRSPSASSRRAAPRPGSPPVRCSTRDLV
jgi:anti-sigma-K factor RskA